MRPYSAPTFGKWGMTLEDLTKTDNGKYTCVVCNMLGCINHTTELSVHGKFYYYVCIDRYILSKKRN